MTCPTHDRRGMRIVSLAICSALLFALNFFVCHELFFTEYTDRVSSGDSNFISISRYMLDHWRDSAWWPIWYNGIPGHDSYPPLMHAIVALLAAVERISPALAHHQFATIVYALAPVGLFLLAERVSGSMGTALAAASAFSLVCPSTLLLPSARLNAGGWLGPWRLCVLGAYGDAPHMFGFALIPFAILALDTALKRRRPVHYLIASFVMAAILLTNWLGSVALACAAVSWLLATTNARSDFSRWARTALIACSAYLLACPWIPPSTLRVIAAGGQVDEGDFRADVRQFPLRALALAAILLVLKYALRRRKVTPGIQFAVFLVLLPGSFPLLFEWAGIALLPTPHRYVWEMDCAICFLAAMLAATFLRRFPKEVAWIAVLAGLLLGAYNLRAWRQYAAALIKPIDMTTTIEYKTAAWLKRNYPGSRVFAIGTVAYWLNNFTDVAQVSGGFDPGTPTPQDRTALKLISKTDSPETTLLWLRAFGADLAVVGGPRTRAPFRTFTAPGRFDKFATKVWSDGDDFIYLIPRRSRSLAQVVRRGDTAGTERYVSALEDNSLPTATFSWQSAHSAVISAEMPQGTVLSIQITFSPGWHASVNGSPRRIEKDELGLMTIDPSCVGTCAVELNYDGGLEALLTRWASLATLTGLVAQTIVFSRLRLLG
jgi:hypothetical protein